MNDNIIQVKNLKKHYARGEVKALDGVCVDIKKGEGRPKLLVIRDSFADSIAPFLAMHYDLIMLDLRYFTDNVQQIVASENVSQVLILESMSEFATTRNISYLKRGIDQ